MHSDPKNLTVFGPGDAQRQAVRNKGLKTTMQVFISSTFKDLQYYRSAAAEGVIAAGHRPFLIENMPAQAMSVQEVINSAIETSDVHLTIIGAFYGSLIPSKNISWTEFETRKAVELGKPGFVYLRLGSNLFS